MLRDENSDVGTCVSLVKLFICPPILSVFGGFASRMDSLLCISGSSCCFWLSSRKKKSACCVQLQLTSSCVTWSFILADSFDADVFLQFVVRFLFGVLLITLTGLLYTTSTFSCPLKQVNAMQKSFPLCRLDTSLILKRNPWVFWTTVFAKISKRGVEDPSWETNGARRFE